MNAVVSDRAEPLEPRFGVQRRTGGQLFYRSMVLAMTATTFAGFAPSYYLKAHFQAPPTLGPLLHFHGIVMSAWMVLLVVQTWLVAAHRTGTHRRLGIAGACLAVLLVITAGWVAFSRARSGVLFAYTGISPLVGLATPFATLIVFPVLFGAAIWLRKRPADHKRLVLLATLELATAGIGRFVVQLPLISSAGLVAAYCATDLFVVAMASHDLVTFKRVHPATLWGGLFLIASQILREMFSTSPDWLAFAGWLTGSGI